MITNNLIKRRTDIGKTGNEDNNGRNDDQELKDRANTAESNEKILFANNISTYIIEYHHLRHRNYNNCYFLPDRNLDLSEIGKKGQVPCITIKVDAPFYNDPAPPERSVQDSSGDPQKDKALMGLWDYEVVEAFFLSSKTQQYLEVEVGPHGHHLVLFLNGRKNIIKECLPIKWEVSIGKVKFN